MRSGILRCYANTLRLRSDAPFPSQLRAIDDEGRVVRYVFKALRRITVLGNNPRFGEQKE